MYAVPCSPESSQAFINWPCGPPHRRPCRERQAAPGPGSGPAGGSGQAGDPGHPRPPTRQQMMLGKGRDNRGGHFCHPS
ncbi:hypothetical protein [Desulforamulus hydrothermalis]|uniref:hypothetical protein n=1 Tax=Desulforamulus hydrothermalis TaxID=412895 RepID=UPI00030BEC1D|nr:hypothetical protein [Desulforamulus hydrothermalis]